MSDVPMVLPAIPLMPPFPVDEDADLLEWARLIHSSYRDTLTTTADRVENSIMVGALADIPTAVGRRQFFLDIDTHQLYLDAWDDSTSTASWVEIPDWGGKGVDGATNYIDFNVDYVDGIVEGRLQWNTDDGTLEVGMPGGNVVGQILQELLVRVKNASGSKIDNGSIVTLSGATGHRPEIALADGSVLALSRAIALATEDIDSGQLGYCNIGVGLVRDIDTSAWAATTPLYLSATTPGALTDTIPDAPNANTRIGFVIYSHATEGSIYFFPNVKPNLTELSDVHHVAATKQGHYLAWVAASSRFELFSAATPIPSVVTKTANYTIPVAPETVLADASGGAFSITLPAAGSSNGLTCSITKTDSSNNAVTVVGQISGSTSWDIPGQWSTMTLEGTGTYWRIK